METEFDKIEREVKNEVQKRLTKIKQKNENDVRANTLLLKAEGFRKKEAKRKLSLTTTVNKSFSQVGSNVGRTVSFKDFIEGEKENKKSTSDFRFEVLEKNEQNLKSTPEILQERKTRNIGVSEVRSIDVRRNKAPVLSSHILPSINIRLGFYMLIYCHCKLINLNLYLDLLL